MENKEELELIIEIKQELAKQIEEQNKRIEKLERGMFGIRSTLRNIQEKEEKRFGHYIGH